MNIRDLCVVDFRSKLLTDDIKTWWQDAGIPYAESCARQVWWGTRQDFEGFPNNQTFEIPKKTGEDAYGFLVKLVLGLDSKVMGETVIKGQFREGFKKFQEDYPEKSKKYEPLVQAVQADSRLVMGQALSKMTTTRNELVARDLSGFKNGEEVLLVSSLNKQGNISDVTDRLAKILGTRNSRNEPKCPKILIISPDLITTKTIEDGLITLKKEHRQFSMPAIGKIEDIPELIEQFPRTFIDLPMGEYPEIDEYMIEAWKGRVNKDHTMVHVRGCPIKRGLSDEMWIGAKLDNYSSPEDIKKESQRRVDVNNVLKSEAIELINVCSKLRGKGVQPSKSKVSVALEHT